MKINENDIRMMNRMMAAEMLLKEAMVGTEDAESNSIPEQVTLYSLIHEMSGLLRDSTVIMKEIGDLVKKYEDNDWEDAGEFISPDAMDLYKAAEYFSGRTGKIKMSDGRVIPVFCLD